MAEPRKARGRTVVAYPDGRNIVIMDGDLIPEGAEIVGEQNEPGFRDAKERGRGGALPSEANASTPERKRVERDNARAARGELGPVAQAAARPGQPSAPGAVGPVAVGVSDEDDTGDDVETTTDTGDTGKRKR